MAYITKEDKAVISAALKVALKDYPSIKWSLSIQDHSKITCTISKGPQCLDIENKGHLQVNHYHIEKFYSPEAAVILKKINECLHLGHYDNSDVQTDYFDCAWYVGINIGKWDKPFIVV
jgi:hypothetical protein